MKKLLLVIFLFLSINNPISAAYDDKVNLTCTLYETFHWDDLTTSKLKPEDVSLVIHPELGTYTFKGATHFYFEVGNEIQFSYNSNCSDLPCMKTDYSLDRTSAVYQYTLSYKDSTTNNKWKKALTHKGKCKITENLF
jgi:hypothetical protein